MNFLDVWHELTYIDGILFSIWVGILYYGKCWIDNKFKCKEEKRSNERQRIRYDCR